jgi:hypothetical protein
VCFANSTRDQLRVLRPEVDDQDGLFGDDLAQ